MRIGRCSLSDWIHFVDIADNASFFFMELNVREGIICQRLSLSPKYHIKHYK